MKDLIADKINDGIYEDVNGEFKADIIELIDVAFELEEYDGIAERLFNKACYDSQEDGFTAILEEVISLTSFFKENMLIVINTLMN